MNDIEFTTEVRDLLQHKMLYSNDKDDIHYLCILTGEVLRSYKYGDVAKEYAHNLMGWIKTIGDDLVNDCAKDTTGTSYYDPDGEYKGDLSYSIGKAWLLPLSYYYDNRLNQFRLDKLNERIKDLKEIENDKRKI